MVSLVKKTQIKLLIDHSSSIGFFGCMSEGNKTHVRRQQLPLILSNVLNKIQQSWK